MDMNIPADSFEIMITQVAPKVGTETPVVHPEGEGCVLVSSEAVPTGSTNHDWVTLTWKRQKDNHKSDDCVRIGSK